MSRYGPSASSPPGDQDGLAGVGVAPGGGRAHDRFEPLPRPAGLERVVRVLEERVAVAEDDAAATARAQLLAQAPRQLLARIVGVGGDEHLLVRRRAAARSSAVSREPAPSGTDTTAWIPTRAESVQIELALDDDHPAAVVLRQVGQAVERARPAARHAPEDLAVAERPELVVEKPPVASL